jgi:hypothetical protein
MKFAFLALAFLPLLVFASAKPTVILTSDIHFDPFTSPKLIPQLARSAPREWDSIF